MVWFRVDDGWHKHRKRIRAGLDMEGMAAQGLWTAAGSWASDELTDGFVPDDIVDYLAPAIGQQLAKRLELARLWVRGERNGEEGWQFWQWEEQQPTAEEVTAALSRKSSGGKLGNHRRWHVAEGKTDPKCPYCHDGADRISDRSSESVPDRSERRTDRSDNRNDVRTRSGAPEEDSRSATSAGNGESRPNRPDSERSSDLTSDRYTDRSQDSHANPTDPTRPDPTHKEHASAVPASSATGAPPKSDPATDPKWLEFWTAYPRKDGRAPALRTWTKVAKSVDPDVVVAGARRYAERMRREHTPREKIKMAQGWLNDRRWEDEQPGANGWDADRSAATATGPTDYTPRGEWDWVAIAGRSSDVLGGDQ